MAILSEGTSIEFYQADSSAEGPRDQEVCDPWNLCFPSIGNVSWSIEDWKMHTVWPNTRIMYKWENYFEHFAENVFESNRCKG